MFEHQGSVLATIEVMEALGCTGQAYIHDARYLLLQSPNRFLVLTGPPRPEAFKRGVSNEAQWHICRPKISAGHLLGVPSASENPHPSRYSASHSVPNTKCVDTRACFRYFFDQWSKEWLSMLVRFPSHSVHHLQWWSAAGTGVSWEYPLLGFLASLRAPGEMLKMAEASNEHLLSMVGIRSVNASAALKVLARLPPEHADLNAARYAKEAFASPRSLRRLCGLRRINRDCLELMTTSIEQYVGDEFLYEISKGDGNPGVPARLRSALHLARQSGKDLPLINSTRQLLGVYQDLRERVVFRKKGVQNWTFKPPFDGVSTHALRIIPITSSIEAMIEGRRQGVCIGDGFMLEALRDGDMAGYIMRAPERGTFTITRTQGGRWRLDEIALADNQGEVHERTREEVIAWLDAVQSKHPWSGGDDETFNGKCCQGCDWPCEFRVIEDTSTRRAHQDA